MYLSVAVNKVITLPACTAEVVCVYVQQGLSVRSSYLLESNAGTGFWNWILESLIKLLDSLP